MIQLKRSLNGQRRTLIAQADFLISQNFSIATEIDCNLLANGLTAIGNYPDAEEYLKFSIEKSDDLVIKHMNIRSYAHFLFVQGNIEAGRSKYKEALDLRMPDSENVKRTVTDTYIMWARVEKEFTFDYEVNRLIELEKKSCERISHKGMKTDMLKHIQLFEEGN